MPTDNSPITLPTGVVLRAPEDFDTLRTSIYDTAKKGLESSFPTSYNGVRMELKDVHYADPDDFPLDVQKEAMLTDKTLGRRLRGSVHLYDDKTGDLLDKRDMTLMKVPHMTERGTFVNAGSDYAHVNQARLLHGAYSRRMQNGNLSTSVNAKTGTGPAFQVEFEPTTAQYRMHIRGSNLHLYSLLHDVGIPDEQLEKTWGPELLDRNRKKYDARVIGKAYEHLVAPRHKLPEHTPEDRVKAIHTALDSVMVHRDAIGKTLPVLLGGKSATAWRAKMSVRQADFEKEIFAPSIPPHEAMGMGFEMAHPEIFFEVAGDCEVPVFEKLASAKSEAKGFEPDLDADGMREAYNAVYAKAGPRLAGMKQWPKHWFTDEGDPLGWISWYCRYADGARGPDDERQINRWKSFKARSVPRFIKNPTVRQAFALRYWAIDPLPLIEDADARKQLKEEMKEHQAAEMRKFSERACDDYPKLEREKEASVLAVGVVPPPRDMPEWQLGLIKYARANAPKDPEKPNPEYKGCLMARLQLSDAKKIIEWAEENIPADQLAEDAFEREVHVTALFGIHQSVTKEELESAVKEIMKDAGGSLILQLKEIHRFPASPHRNSDVIVLKCESPWLEELHYGLIEKLGDKVQVTYPEFRPHVTVAYVKPGALKHLDDSQVFDGQLLPLSPLIYSIADRTSKQEIEMFDAKMEKEAAARVASRIASRIAKIFRPAQFTHTGVAPGKNLSGAQPKMWEAWRQHARLQQMREGLATSKPNFSFNVPHPNTGAMVPHDVHLADSILHTSPNYKPHDRLLTHARIRNTATGQTWEQPMYRSSGATVEHGGTAPAAGHWLPTSGVHGADPSYLAKAQRANAATRARYPNTPEVNYDTYAKTLSDPRVAAQRVMPGTEPGWIGKQQFDPASGQWVTHDKTDKTLLPIYQHLRDAMGEYAGQLKTASLLIEEGVEKSAAYVPVENAFEKAAAAWQEMRKSGTVGMVEPVRRPRVATGKIPMNWDAEPRPTAPGKAPGAEINLMDSKSTVNPADFKTPYYGDQFPAQLEQAAQYNSKNKLPNTTDGWQRPVTVVTRNPTSNSQYAPFVRQGIHGNAVFMPADAGKFLHSQAPEMAAAGAKPADLLAHEVNHAAGDNWAVGEHDDAYFVGSSKDPGYAGRQNFMDRLPHDLIPGEHRGYMSTIQAQMFKDTGSRITSPEAYDKWLESMNVHHTDPAVFENSIKSVPVDAQRMLRGMRDPAADPAYLKSLKQWQRRVMPGIVQQAAPMQEKYAAAQQGWSPADIQELQARVAADQKSRQGVNPTTMTSAAAQQAESGMAKMDRDNTAWLQSIIEKNGWPTGAPATTSAMPNFPPRLEFIKIAMGLKAPLSAIRNLYRGLQGMGFNKGLRGSPFSRIMPEAVAARTQTMQAGKMLPVGTSNHFRGTIQVGKGSPRANIPGVDTGPFAKPAVPGGTNPSPLSSAMHEAGHAVHDKQVGNWHWNASRPLGDTHPVRNMATIASEFNANNTAVQMMRQAGIPQHLIGGFVAARAPSFATYLSSAAQKLNPMMQSALASPAGDPLRRFAKPYADVMRKIIGDPVLQKGVTPSFSLRKDLEPMLDALPLSLPK